MCYNIGVVKSGYSADGSALPWGGRGRGFKSRYSDQQKEAVLNCLFFFLEKIKIIFLFIKPKSNFCDFISESFQKGVKNATRRYLQ